MYLYESHCIFPVPDIEKTASFYTEKLSFQRVDYLKAEEPHICLYRDHTEIILTSASREVIPNRELYGYGYDAYFITDQQEALQKEFMGKDVKIVRPLSMTDYHNTEFVIEDLNRRWIAFGIKEK